jgi:hypothetical protein
VRFIPKLNAIKAKKAANTMSTLGIIPISLTISHPSSGLSNGKGGWRLWLVGTDVYEQSVRAEIRIPMGVSASRYLFSCHDNRNFIVKNLPIANALVSNNVIDLLLVIGWPGIASNHVQ